MSLAVQETDRQPVYLGDGAYANFDPIDVCGLRIYTSDGIRVENEVFLGPHELEVLLRYARVRSAYADAIRRAMG